MKCQGTKTSSQGRQDTLLTVEAAVADCLIFFISRVSALMNPTHLWSPDILCAEVLASVADRAAIGADFVVNLEFRWIFSAWSFRSRQSKFKHSELVFDDCSLLKSFVCIVQCNPVQCDGLEWSLNCIRMFLCSTLTHERQFQMCVCVCEND